LPVFIFRVSNRVLVVSWLTPTGEYTISVHQQFPSRDRRAISIISLYLFSQIFISMSGLERDDCVCVINGNNGTAEDEELEKGRESRTLSRWTRWRVCCAALFLPFFPHVLCSSFFLSSSSPPPSSVSAILAFFVERKRGEQRLQDRRKPRPRTARSDSLFFMQFPRFVRPRRRTPARFSSSPPSTLPRKTTSGRNRPGERENLRTPRERGAEGMKERGGNDLHVYARARARV